MSDDKPITAALKSDELRLAAEHKQRHQEGESTFGGVVPLDAITLPPGANVGRYVILNLLGQGGMGRVYAAFDPQLGRRVALKMLRATREAPEESQARLMREAQAMARVSHPNVVSVYDVGLHENAVFVAMEFIEGSNLREWLSTPHSETEKLSVLLAAGRGLAAAHEKGLVHRDFKPDNVLIGKDGRVLVSDFGLAHARDAVEPTPPAEASASFDSHASNSALQSPLTQMGTVVGTLGFMPPEQALGQATDARSDQFSFAVTAWFTLYGEMPFERKGLRENIAAMMAGPKPPPRASNRASWRPLTRALAPSPEKRFADLPALLKALAKDPRRTRRAWAAVGTGIAVVALIVSANALQRRRKDQACRESSQSLSREWKLQSKAKARGAFEATALPFAADAWKRVELLLDGFTDEWARASYAACSGSSVTSQELTRWAELKGICLERSADELRALSALFTQADASVVRHAVQAAQSLASPSRCSDLRHLESLRNVPADPTTRERVTALQKQLAQVTALSRAGQYQEGVREARALLEEAKRAGWPGTRAQLWFALGQLLVGVEDFDGAVSAQQEAFLLAHEAGDLLLEAQVASELVYCLGWIRDRYAEAALWARLSEVALRKYGGDPRTEITLLERRARSLFAQKQYAAALPLIERALASSADALRSDDELLSQLHDTYGAVLGGLGRTDESRREYVSSLTLAESALGRQHPRLAQLYNNLGFSLLSDARYEDALAPLQHALELFARENGKGLGVGIVKGNLAQVLTQLGRAQEAVPLARESLAIVEQERGEQHAMLDTYFTPLGWALLRSGHPQEAAKHCGKAAQLQERAGRSAADFLPFESDSLTCLGEAQLQLGQLKAAQATLRKAVKSQSTYPGGLAEARFALARALGPKSPEARALAAQAHDEWNTRRESASFEARCRDVERWLRD